jgi:leucyl-tRNA synthetase
VRTTTSAITSAEAAQLKKKGKGKSISFDPKLPKKITIFAATSYPAWQDKYINMVRASFDSLSLTINEKELGPKIPKDEMKKAMPFIQSLKRRLVAGESEATVFERKLAFDEVDVLQQMRAGLRKTTGCTEVEIVAVDEGGKSGVVLGERRGEQGPRRQELPLAAQMAEPGTPSFHFENVQSK